MRGPAGSTQPPEPAKGPQRRRRGRILVGVALSFALLLALIAVGGFLLVQRYTDAFHQGDLLDPSARNGRHGPVDGPLNILLIGSDYRTWSPQAGERSDTIIIAHVDRAMDHVYLISIPRDLLVTIPPDAKTGYRGSSTKINAAFDAGNGGSEGIQLLSRTLNQLSGIRFDGAAAVEFDGLKKAVDLVGGVRMCVDVRTVSIHTGKVYPVGCRLMNSTDVLDYLRQRQYADGDFTRQRHQQQFLAALVDRAQSTGLTTDPVKLDQFLRSVAGSLTVDTGDASLPDVVLALRGLRSNQMSGLKLPSDATTQDGVSYVVAGPDAKGLYAAINSDTLDLWTRQHPQWVNKT